MRSFTRRYAQKISTVLSEGCRARLRRYFSKDSFYDAAVSVLISESFEQALREYRINRGLKSNVKANQLMHVLKKVCDEGLLCKPSEESDVFAELKMQIELIAFPRQVTVP